MSKNKKRNYKNSGYSSGGASLKKNTLKNWHPKHFSAKEDIDRNLSRLRDRAADLAINSALGAAAIKTQLTGVVNAGLKIFPRVNSDILNLSTDDARAWNRKTKAEFDLWAASANCDFYNRNNFFELQRIAYTNELTDGDCFCLFRRRSPNDKNPYSLKLQLIEAQRVSNPNGYNFEIPGKKKDSRIVNGIEVDRDGIFQAVWISNRIWNEIATVNPKLFWRRVKVFGEQTFTRNILHLCYDTRIEQFRGEPYLAPVIETLKNVDRYSEAELTSAIIKAFFALFFTQPEGNFDLDQIGLRNKKGPDDPCIDPTEYRAENGSVIALPRGVNVQAIDNSNAQSTFDSFVNNFIQQTASALNLPAELMLKKFDASYSASRAALLQAQDEFRQRRISFINDFCAPVYENFLTEAVALGRIDAPGFFDDEIIRAAWTNSDWRSEGSHLIDPVKELTASKMKIELGLSTRAKEAAEICGTDFEENLQQLILENNLLSSLNQN